eukprot:COSAG05_NODE_300_length_11883_cov_12.913357_6_plen_226_part_00
MCGARCEFKSCELRTRSPRCSIWTDGFPDPGLASWGDGFQGDASPSPALASATAILSALEGNLLCLLGSALPGGGGSNSIVAVPRFLHSAESDTHSTRESGHAVAAALAVLLSLGPPERNIFRDSLRGAGVLPVVAPWRAGCPVKALRPKRGACSGSDRRWCLACGAPAPPLRRVGRIGPVRPTAPAVGIGCRVGAAYRNRGGSIDSQFQSLAHVGPVDSRLRKA